MKHNFLLISFLLIITQSSFSQVQSEWRGIGRTGVYYETGLLEKWPEEGPKMIWSHDMPNGYSSVSIANNSVYLTGMVDTMDVLIALDMNGKQKWQIYITSGYNHAGAMFKLNNDATDVELLWNDTILDTHHGGVVKVGDYIYGANWINNSKGNWCCIDWQTGKTQYETKWKTKGSIISADGKLYCYEERSGNIALVEATPEIFKIISSFKIPFGKVPYWSHPVIKDGILYVRHGTALMAYNIKDKEKS